MSLTPLLQVDRRMSDGRAQLSGHAGSCGGEPDELELRGKPPCGVISGGNQVAGCSRAGIARAPSLESTGVVAAGGKRGDSVRHENCNLDAPGDSDGGNCSGGSRCMAVGCVSGQAMAVDGRRGGNGGAFALAPLRPRPSSWALAELDVPPPTAEQVLARRDSLAARREDADRNHSRDIWTKDPHGGPYRKAVSRAGGGATGPPALSGKGGWRPPAGGAAPEPGYEEVEIGPTTNFVGNAMTMGAVDLVLAELQQLRDPEARSLRLPAPPPPPNAFPLLPAPEPKLALAVAATAAAAAEATARLVRPSSQDEGQGGAALAADEAFPSTAVCGASVTSSGPELAGRALTGYCTISQQALAVAEAVLLDNANVAAQAMPATAVEGGGGGFTGAQCHGGSGGRVGSSSHSNGAPTDGEWAKIRRLARRMLGRPERVCS